jgi:hypothetical protein
MSDQAPLQFLPLRAHEWDSLPAGFDYPHTILEDFNADAFGTKVDVRDLRRCVVRGKEPIGGPKPGVKQAHII